MSILWYPSHMLFGYVAQRTVLDSRRFDRVNILLQRMSFSTDVWWATTLGSLQGRSNHSHPVVIISVGASVTLQPSASAVVSSKLKLICVKAKCYCENGYVLRLVRIVAVNGAAVERAIHSTTWPARPIATSHLYACDAYNYCFTQLFPSF